MQSYCLATRALYSAPFSQPPPRRRATLKSVATRFAPAARNTASPAFRRYAFAVLLYNVLVVLWGAIVRATGSGAGCGNHWPLCNGVVVPRAAAVQTIIEFTHRLMSGASLAAVVLLVVWAFLAFPSGHVLRRATLWALGFLFLEALLGAGLVLFDYVAKNVSVGRVVYLAAHLTNTQLLLASLAVVAWLASQPPSRPAARPLPASLAAALIAALVVCVSGAIAALGDTLFPATSLTAGLHQDFSSSSNLLLRLRLAHPVIALLGAAIVVFSTLRVLRAQLPKLHTNLALAVLLLTIAQLLAGALNVALLAPVPMQIFHLLLADALWIALVFLSLAALHPNPIAEPRR
jgi:cytochrome c oxidase assembly protein subunit 15